LVIAPEWIEAVRQSMPELPASLRARFVSDYGLAPVDAANLTSSRELAEYFEQTTRALPAGQAKLAANWVMGEVSAVLNREEKDISASPVTSAMLAALLTRIVDGTISNKIARDVFAAMWAGEHGGQPDAIIEAKGLKQISDSGAIEGMIDSVLADNPAIVAEYRAGKQKAFNSLVGQIMKAAKGKANPQQVNDLLKAKLDS
jgi:aspartyl-tRNA(Asn)/glutamyl-tRNA(Gln) amidotransferase subunit B